jgi:hypothetical protein
VGLKSQLGGAGVQLTLFLGNKAGEALQGVALVVPPNPAFALQLGSVPQQLEPKKQVGEAAARGPAVYVYGRGRHFWVLGRAPPRLSRPPLAPPPRFQVQVPLSAACLAPFLATPVVQLGYAVPSTGQVLSRSLELPLVATKFCAPVEVPPSVFTQRWQQVAGPPLKAGVALGGGATRGGAEALLPTLGFKVLAGLDGPAGLSAACVFQCGPGTPPRQVPCMVKVEGLGGPGATLTVATADAMVTDALKQRLAALLA